MILDIDPKVDYAFKRVFGSSSCERRLIDVLQSTLYPQLTAPITSIEIANPFNDKEALDDKLSILDIKAIDSAGRRFNVEMQMLPDRYFCPRVVYYGSKLHSQQLREGEDYNELQPTYVICFVNGIIFREVAEYRLMFELRNREHPDLLFSPQLSICLIELPKFQLDVESLATPLERWCYLLRHAQGLDTLALPEQLKSPMIEEAVEVLSMLSQTPVERERYESRLKAQRDLSSGLKGARLDGIYEGKLEGKREDLEELLQSKFGSTGPEFIDRFREMLDLAELKKAFALLLSAQSLEEYREMMASIPGKPT